MKRLDRVLQRLRIAQARPFIARGARVLDIGSSDGTLFQELGTTLGGAMGIDPTLRENRRLGDIPLIAGRFPKDMPPAEAFDVITMLAVLEHFAAGDYAALRAGCLQFLKPGGHLIITVPSPKVDYILKALLALRLIDGMSLEEHHGYDIRETTRIFPPPDFELVKHQRFQLGLNNLFVFRRR
jgi:2-polyprenyl-3-methyl-5-hydroxy-6-metoxy-1,4-benzoquinol methylase